MGVPEFEVLIVEEGSQSFSKSKRGFLGWCFSSHTVHVLYYLYRYVYLPFSIVASIRRAALSHASLLYRYLRYRRDGREETEGDRREHKRRIV